MVGKTGEKRRLGVRYRCRTQQKTSTPNSVSKFRSHLVKLVKTSIWRPQQISKISKLQTRVAAKVKIIPKN